MIIYLVSFSSCTTTTEAEGLVELIKNLFRAKSQTLASIFAGCVILQFDHAAPTEVKEYGSTHLPFLFSTMLSPISPVLNVSSFSRNLHSLPLCSPILSPLSSSSFALSPSQTCAGASFATLSPGQLGRCGTECEVISLA